MKQEYIKGRTAIPLLLKEEHILLLKVEADKRNHYLVEDEWTPTKTLSTHSIKE